MSNTENLGQLCLITWRLADLPVEQFEVVSRHEFVPNTSVSNDGIGPAVFVLKTCERVLISLLCPTAPEVCFSTDPYLNGEHSCAISPRLAILNTDATSPRPIFYSGVEAFRHLCLVAGSLDSS